MINPALISNTATALVGAAFFSLAVVGITVPAHAAPVGFQQSVEASLGKTMRFPRNTEAKGVATVAVLVDADGAVSETKIVKSSGDTQLDREAVRTARAVSYPASGKARNVAMVLGFNQKATPAQISRGKRIVEAYRNDRRQLLADQMTARPLG